MCDFHPFVHVIKGAEDPKFPPRRKHYLCAASGQAEVVLPPPRAHLSSHYRHVLEQRSFAGCLSQAGGSGNTLRMQSRLLPNGLSSLRGLCAVEPPARDGNGAAAAAGRRVDVELTWRMRSRERDGGGGKHLVMRGMVRRADGEADRDEVVVRAALPRGWGLPGFTMHTPRVLNCTGAGPSGELDPSRCPVEGWAAFQRTCDVHLGMRTSPHEEYGRMQPDELRGAGGKDLATMLYARSGSRL